MARLRSMAVGLLLTAWCVLALISCAKSEQSITAADGLNLHAVTTLVNQPRDGEHFEHLLNTSGINNLDLDGDGHIDYINVTEYGDADFRGFSLSTMLNNGSIQQIAEIQFQRSGNEISFQVHGNPQIYGANYYIRPPRPLTIGQVVFIGWLFSPRVVYVSPYNSLSPPPTYVRVRVMPVTTYRTVTTKTIQTSGMQVQQVQKPVITSPVQSPNEGKSSAAIIAPLREPTQTQKQFQERPEVKEIQQAKGFVKKDPKAPVPQPQVVTPDTQPRASQPAHGANAPAAPYVMPDKDKKTTDKDFKVRDENKDVPRASGFTPKEKEPVVKKEPSVMQKKSR